MSQYRDTTGRAEGAMHDAKNRLREGMESAKSAAADTRERMNEKMHEARERMHHMQDDMRDRWDSLRETDYDEVWDSVKSTVRENPGPALLIAGAVGLAIGVMLAGSSAAARRRF